ncbi:MAG: N-methyl-L-tryptophan oxidase [Actinomycetota bacterium]|nr:N-methyl-L-tryptophan oxidase [Actinomycetota bacterium]
MVEQVEYVVVGLGAFGSATAYALARGGADVLGLEQFELGHVRGASHDTSRILRHSYHTPGYVALTVAAYDDWASLEREAGERLVTVVGGLDLFPAEATVPVTDHTGSLSANDVPYEVLEPSEVQQRFPQFVLPPGTVGLYQQRAAIVPAARGTQVMQQMARAHGARLQDRCAVTAVRDRGDAGIDVDAGGQTYRCRRLVVCADAWTNRVLEGLDVRLPLKTTQEQFSYFAPADPAAFSPGRMPLWIWLGEQSFYGFPCYGEATVKVAQDCGGPPVTGDSRSFDPDPGREALVADFVARTLPGIGRPVRSKTCLYTLTPERDFALGPVPGHSAAFAAIGAGHGFKFSPTIGRLLAELATTGECTADIGPFRLDRPVMVDPPPVDEWAV